MKFEPQMHTLPNGLTVFLDPMDLETTNVKVQFRTGSHDEQPHEYGITHFCEHMLGKGTTRFPTKKSIDEHIEYHGGTRNASTGNVCMNLYGRIIGRNTGVLIDFFGDVLQNSLFDPAKIDIERRVICDELRRAMDDTNRQMAEFTSQKLFNGDMGAYRTLGSVENIMSFSRDQMLEFMARRLSTRNCVVAVSGQIADTNAILQQITDTFAFLPTHPVSSYCDYKYTPAVAHNSQPEKKNVKLRIVFPGKIENTFQNMYADMCVSRFEMLLQKHLSQILRQENGLVYGFNMCALGMPELYLNGFETSTSVENLPTVVSLIARNAHKFYQDTPIDDADLDRIHRKMELSDADFLESAGSRSRTLIGHYYDYNRLYDRNHMLSLRNQINVSDIIKYSRGYFDGQMSIITQGADYDFDLAGIWRENFN